MADAKTTSKNSDLPVRLASAVVMVAIAGTALWLGGNVWGLFVAIIGLAGLWEWLRLVKSMTSAIPKRVLGIVGGILYIGSGCAFLIAGREQIDGDILLPVIVGAVVATDVGAYFAGRAIGGPKIAPSISPSKTWAGLVGGMIAAGVFLVLTAQLIRFAMTTLNDEPRLSDEPSWLMLMIMGAGVAIVAQAGDFLESWMKRKAGMKDSSNLIPGHGGVLDRIDGLLAVCFALSIFSLVFYLLLS